MKIIGLNENNQATPFVELGDVLVLNGGDYVSQIIQTKSNPEAYGALTLQFQDGTAEEIYTVDTYKPFVTPFDVYDSYVKEGFNVDIIKSNRLELHIK